MRQRFHERALALLGDEAPNRRERSIEPLLEWARQHDVRVPAAYLEWARIDDGSLLRRYSNDDWFWIDRPKLFVTPEGARALRFNSENQNNFDRAVVLEQGDDPPVLFAWLNRPPWVTYAERFSDAVFAQLFDWQYMFEFDPGNPGEKLDMAFSTEIRLETDHCVDVLRHRYQEEATTRYVIDGVQHTEFRFMRSPTERMRVLVNAHRGADIHVTGAKTEGVAALEAQLLELFSDEVQPSSFNSVGWAAEFLSYRIDKGWTTQLRHAFIQKPEAEAIHRLIECHRAAPLKARMTREAFPIDPDPQHFTIGGVGWGITLSFRRQDRYWWRLESVR